MYEKRYEFVLTGISPLIMHWDNIEWGDQIKEERTRIKEQDKKNFEAGDDRCPPHTWKGYTYNDGQFVAMPADNLRATLCKAAAKITLKDRTTYKSLSQSGVLFDAVFAPMYFNGKQLEWAKVNAIDGTFAEQCRKARELGFRLFPKRAAVGSSKHVRVRPMFEVWGVRGTVTVGDEQVSETTLKRMFEIAGLKVGLCDWRPGAPKSPGPYGRFTSEVKAA